jgi:lipopolysaccharide heptosyltransferase II
MNRHTRLSASVANELQRGGRILVTRLQYLGDVVISLALVQKLREHFPRATIDYLTRSDGADVLTGEPAIEAVHTVPSDGLAEQLKLIQRLRGRRYAVAVDLYSNPRSALLTWLSGARMRIGGSRRGRRQFYTHATAVPAEVRSASEFHLYHVRPLGIEGPPVKPLLTISKAERREATAFLEAQGLDLNMPVVGLHPGGKWEVKRWPPEFFAALATRLSSAYGMQIAVLSGPGEEAWRDAVVNGAKAVGAGLAVLPTLSIRRTAAIVQTLDGAVMNDGGIMHVSVAVGTPTVGIFGSAEPDIWFPYESFGPYRAAWVPITCRPCHSHHCTHISCLRKLTVERVEHSLLSVIRSNTAALGGKQ